MPEFRDVVVETYRRTGSVAATAKELGKQRSTIRFHLKKAGLNKKPLAGGREKPQKLERRKINKDVHRFIVTSAQNNTFVDKPTLKNLEAFAKFYKAEFFVGTFSYNQNSYGQLAVKAGTKKAYETKLWFDPALENYIKAGDNRNIEIGPHLMWCGRANVLPTAIRPLENFENYSGRHSGIFPHAKQMMECVASMKHEATKFNYTTGTVTQQNYIQKKAGLVAEQHHTYGGLIVEVCKDGRWYVRQLVQDAEGCMFDLSYRAKDGKVTGGHRPEGINWGDVHKATLPVATYNIAFGKGGMLDTLRPKYQFIHDVLDWKARDLFVQWRKLPRDAFINYVEGFDSVEAEINDVGAFFRNIERDYTETIVVESNHDDFFLRWLDVADHRKDPINARFFLKASTYLYDYMWVHKREPNMLKWACGNGLKNTRFLSVDESFIICKKYRGGIECGMHGNFGPNGAGGSTAAFNRMGRRVNVGHAHTSYLSQWGTATAGLLGDNDQGYNHGPSSWSNTQILTYSNGARAMITFWKGDYKA